MSTTDFVRRYERDTSRPTLRQARSDLTRRTLAPAVGLLAAIIGIGLLIVGPLDSLPGEVAVNADLAANRTPTLDALTAVWSTIGQTEFIILGCLVALALVWWRTRQWWLAVVPSIAVAVQAAVFITSAFVVGRERPDVEALDVSPPTSGFPSGHTGASTAFYLTLALLARRVRHPALRWAATVVCLLVPLLVAYARLYRGLHHPSDVVVGALNGLVCVVLAWRYLERGTATSDPAVPRPREGVHPVRREPERGEGEQDGAERQSRDGPQDPVQPLRLL
jgi:undecaprenyl-diphosphatase